MEWSKVSSRVYQQIMSMIPLSKDSGVEKTGIVSSQVINNRNINRYISDIEIILIGIEESEYDCLATYKPMQSKGKITFFWKRMGVYFWSIIHQLDRQGTTITQSNLEYLCEIFILSVNRHERFHHECDVIRKLFETHYTRNIEEALAVACSYLSLWGNRRDKRTLESKVSIEVFEEFLRIRFSYKKAGYRDWVNYQSEEDFLDGITQYLAPQSPTKFLSSNEVNVGGIVREMQESVGCGGFDYEISDVV